jgi:hypothetical protein
VEVPAPLAAIVLRTLRRARDDRYPTAQAVQLDLERCARGHELAISAPGTAAYLETLFGARVSHWRAAMKSGQSLAEHLTDEVSAPAPPVADRTVTDGFVDHAWSGQVARSSKLSKPARAARRRGRVFSRLGMGGVAVGLAVVGVVVTLSALGRHPAAPTVLPTVVRMAAESPVVAVAATTPAVVTTAPTPAPPTPSPSPSTKTTTATAGLATARSLRASARGPAPGRRRETSGSPPSAPPPRSVIKVWDPDSPVPP